MQHSPPSIMDMVSQTTKDATPCFPPLKLGDRVDDIANNARTNQVQTTHFLHSPLVLSVYATLKPSTPFPPFPFHSVTPPPLPHLTFIFLPPQAQLQHYNKVPVPRDSLVAKITTAAKKGLRRGKIRRRTHPLYRSQVLGKDQ